MAFKVLFVDDEPDVLKLLKSLVEPLGFEVLTLADSREAARRLQTEKFDAVFLDARMPHLDGFELAKTIRTSPANSGVPMVMLTVYNDAETMRKGFKAGISFFLGKPVSQDRMAGMLRAMRGAMLKEKRRHARLPLRTSVTCQLGPTRFKSESQNIGEGGMLLDMSGGANVGQELEIEFLLPQASSPVKAQVTVLRKQPPDKIAVRFLALTPSDREAIVGYINGKITD